MRQLLRRSPVVAILGARQVGKTTLARDLIGSWPGAATTFDLEHPPDAARLTDPVLALSPRRGLVALGRRLKDLAPLP